jgi:hypothetical protein
MFALRIKRPLGLYTNKTNPREKRCTRCGRGEGIVLADVNSPPPALFISHVFDIEQPADVRAD